MIQYYKKWEVVKITFTTITIFFIGERQSHVHIENYFERIKLIYTVSDF